MYVPLSPLLIALSIDSITSYIEIKSLCCNPSPNISMVSSVEIFSINFVITPAYSVDCPFPKILKNRKIIQFNFLFFI